MSRRTRLLFVAVVLTAVLFAGLRTGGTALQVSSDPVPIAISVVIQGAVLHGLFQPGIEKLLNFALLGGGGFAVSLGDVVINLDGNGFHGGSSKRFIRAMD